MNNSIITSFLFHMRFKYFSVSFLIVLTKTVVLKYELLEGREKLRWNKQQIMVGLGKGGRLVGSQSNVLWKWYNKCKLRNINMREYVELLFQSKEMFTHCRHATKQKKRNFFFSKCDSECVFPFFRSQWKSFET